MLAVGLFAENPKPLDTTSGRSGLFRGGGWYLLGIQALSTLCLTIWSLASSVCLLWFINHIIPIRMDAQTELIGADLIEHKVRHAQVGVSRALSALDPVLETEYRHAGKVDQIGINPGHNSYLKKFYSIRRLGMNRLRPYKVRMNQNIINDVKIMKESRLLPIIEGKVCEPKSKLLIFYNPDGSVIQHLGNRTNFDQGNGRVNVQPQGKILNK